MEGQTESILAALTKAWARFSVKAQVRGFEKYTWARLRHAILDTHVRNLKTTYLKLLRKSHVCRAVRRV